MQAQTLAARRQMARPEMNSLLTVTSIKRGGLSEGPTDGMNSGCAAFQALRLGARNRLGLRFRFQSPAMGEKGGPVFYHRDVKRRWF